MAEWDPGCFTQVSQADIRVSALELWSIYEATVCFKTKVFFFNKGDILWLLHNLAGISLWQCTQQCADDGDNEDNAHIW